MGLIDIVQKIAKEHFIGSETKKFYNQFINNSDEFTDGPIEKYKFESELKKRKNFELYVGKYAPSLLELFSVYVFANGLIEDNPKALANSIMILGSTAVFRFTINQISKGNKSITNYKIGKILEKSLQPQNH